MPEHRTVLVALGAAVVLAGGIVAAVLIGGGSGATAGKPDLVKVELRARPVAEIKFRGRKLGTTPLTINLPRSSTPETVEATFEITKYHLKTGDKITERKVATKTFVPDAPQAVDFAVEDAR